MQKCNPPIDRVFYMAQEPWPDDCQHFIIQGVFLILGFMIWL